KRGTALNFCFLVLRIGKPVPTFPEALFLWSCFLSENRFPLFRKHSFSGRASYRKTGSHFSGSTLGGRLRANEPPHRITDVNGIRARKIVARKDSFYCLPL